MATANAAWGIEIGAFAVKALRLERVGDEVEVSDYAVIPHKRVLCTPDIDVSEVVRMTLGQLISQKQLDDELIVMSIQGHSSLVRFAKLPPVEPKKIPDIVKFEAVQQIPFPIDEVEWDYQVFQDEDSPEVEVGLFAVTREKIAELLGLYGEVGLSPEVFTLSPLALFNAMHHDFKLHNETKPVVFIDIGTTATDVVIAQGDRCWIRTFPIGGNHFTAAIADAFKISHAKAERLKQEAHTSKYAKQIMQSMRGVFRDLLGDLQRSLGYFANTHPDTPLTDMVGVGSTFRIPGLRKFIGMQLEVQVQRLDEFRRIRVQGKGAAGFAEHNVNLATAYGLALQGVGLECISANLVPGTIRREQLWRRKTKWFVAAAAVAVAAGGVTFIRPISEGAAIGPLPSAVKLTVKDANTTKSNYEKAKQDFRKNTLAPHVLAMLDNRNIWPWVIHDAATSLRQASPQAALFGNDLAAIRSIDPTDRRLVEMTDLRGYYQGEGENGPTITVTMTVELTSEDPVKLVQDTVVDWLRKQADAELPARPYRIVDARASRSGGQNQ